MPFIWSFTWFMYWIIHDSVVLRKPLIQTSLVNLVGSIISVAVVIVGTGFGRKIKPLLILSFVKIKTSAKSFFPAGKIRIRNRVQTISSQNASRIKNTIKVISANGSTQIKKSTQKISVSKPIQIRKAAQTSTKVSTPPIKLDRNSYLFEKFKTDENVKTEKTKPQVEEPKPEQQIPPLNEPDAKEQECPHYDEYFAQAQRPKEIPMHCLVCENVVRCVSTQKKTRH
jgi:hypothetical protein